MTTNYCKETNPFINNYEYYTNSLFFVAKGIPFSFERSA